MSRISVCILTDRRLVAEGLRRLLETQEDFEVTSVPPASWSPEGSGRPSDLLLLDAQVEGALQWSRRLSPQRPVVLFGLGLAPEDALDALRAGAHGILLQNATPEELVQALRRVREGEISAPGSVVKRALDVFSALPSSRPRKLRPALDLTPREQEIARLTTRGLSNREVAECVAISEATVKAHLTRIFRKLSVRDRMQLLLVYPQQGATGAGDIFPPGPSAFPAERASVTPMVTNLARSLPTES